jgi:hypothetical protein
LLHCNHGPLHTLFQRRLYRLHDNQCSRRNHQPLPSPYLSASSSVCLCLPLLSLLDSFAT